MSEDKVPKTIIEAYFNLTVLNAELLRKVNDKDRPMIMLALGTLMGAIGQYIFKDIEAIKEAHKKWEIENPELAGKYQSVAEA